MDDVSSSLTGSSKYMYTLFLGRLWICFDKYWNTLKFQHDVYSIYKWELYIPYCRITWLRK